ncbi:hypothetical protein LIER_09505 [Lithospermum erythrorhizon]|uniref:Uncharacterized protein n=1 Tax=Lithospermum erythrorhizon TaxID=34254 RepID=A0AAV3PJS0_LITER
MYEFGEEFIIESYKVPWLIWIQLLIMILLIILLFCGLTIFSDDSTDSIQTTNNYSAASSSGQSQVNNNATSLNSQVAEIQNVKGNSEGDITPEQIQAREGPPTKDIRFKPLRPEHPCHFLGLAKQAFLKCLGIDSVSESSDDRNEHLKTD